jgi:signal transduction histidine kinase
MFSSLRSRLWLTYSLITAAALSVVALVLFVFLATNPFLYRQASARLSLADTVLVREQADLAALPPEQLARVLKRVGDTFEVRSLIFDSRRQLIADSMGGEAEALNLPRLRRLRTASAVPDAQGKLWLYTLTRLDNGGWLMVTTPRPPVPLLSVLRDEFFAPILQAAIVSLVLSLVLAYWVARWVADPIQRLVAASHKLPDSALPPLAEQGPLEVKELVSAFNSMTARVQASQKAQRDFVANVSHEMKTPLTSIQGFAQAILDGTADSPEAQKQSAGIIYSEAGRMHRLVLDLLDLARLDSGTANLKSEPVDITSLLNSVGERFGIQARMAGIEVWVEADELPLLRGDGDRLAQVLTNLVDNSIHHNGSGGRVTLAAHVEGERLIISVSDTGVGIPADVLPHIFDRFYRGDPSRTGGQDHGAGLGLAIAREIVIAHHGTITAQSEPGQGSTFTVRLPLASPEPENLHRRRK